MKYHCQMTFFISWPLFYLQKIVCRFAYPAFFKDIQIFIQGDGKRERNRDCITHIDLKIDGNLLSFFRIWKVSRRFSLKPDICQAFFATCLKASNVQVLDFSHCFWLPEATLLQSCLSPALNNLKELNVSDTQLSLVSVLLHVLPQCHSLTKLSVNILEPTWEAFNDKLQGVADTYKENFKKLTHLKLYTLDSNSPSPSIWLLFFNVLG